MRRSKAPSQLGKPSPPLGSNQAIPPKKNSETGFKNTVNLNTGRSKESILNLILKGASKANVPNAERNNHENDDNNENVADSNIIKEVDGKPIGKSSTRIFNVVYGKQSMKKHKTWEGDGILEVGPKSATLKDMDGKILGQVSHRKTEELTEGCRLFVGSKEVEIIDLFEGEVPLTKKRAPENDGSTSLKKVDVVKKIKKSHKVPVSLLTSDLKFSTANDFVPLLMPHPDDEHQWNFNTDHLPLTDVSVDGSLCKVLRSHQREGVVFLYKCITGIRSMKYRGAILADEMGLGKTLQCVTLVWTLLRQGPYGQKSLIKRVLIVAPSSLVQNWNNEFMKWIGSHKICTFVVDKNHKPQEYKKFPHVPVFIISYEMFVRCFDEMKNINFELLICDEGHRLKNNNNRTTTLLNDLPCKQRIILTGTPVQNDLQEYYTLVDFVNPGILGSPSDFRKEFETPIVASQNPQAPEEVVSQGEQKAEELNRITSGFILRRTQDILDSFLPQKYEYVLFCEPTELQKKIYTEATNYWMTVLEEKLNSKETVVHLSVITALKKICNHPILIQKHDDNQIAEQGLSQILNSVLRQCNGQDPIIEDSSKLLIVGALLKFLSKTKERIVLVSNFTQTLDLLGALCDQYGFKYSRLDGSTPTSKRMDIVNHFNSPTSNAYVLLLSSKAGGVGLNLIGASRLVLFDSDWNPATDIQAMARIWREGQKKNVHIYRLLTVGTIEEKIFQRQLSKAGLNESIVDTSCTSSVKLSVEEMKDLFSFNNDSVCLTHRMLKCECSGDGKIMNSSEIDTETEEERDCELSLTNSSANTCLRMNQLYQWEHYSHPVSYDLLHQMGLVEVAGLINFIFRNQTVKLK